MVWHSKVKMNNLTLTVRSQNQALTIDIQDIIYIQKSFSFVSLYLEENRVMEVTTTLSIFKSLLPDNFLQIHRCYIVNRHKIKSIKDHQVILSNNQVLQIGLTYRHTLNKERI